MKHDLLIIGAGPGGYVAAIRAAQLGLDVACIEREPDLGGTCLRVGCIPSKALLESSEKYLEAREGLSQHGVKVSSVKLDIAAMMKRKSQIVDSLTDGVAQLFQKNKVVRYQGVARIIEPGLVEINGSKRVQQIQGDNIIIATGSRPANLPGIELGGSVGTSDEAISYDKVPAHLVVIGAGYIGLEMSSVWNRLGSKVTVLEYLPRILPGMDSELAAEAQKIFTKQGIEFRLGCKVTGAREVNGKCVVEIEGAEPLDCDKVLVAVGRTPYIDGLGLDQLQVALDQKGFIKVDDDFQTNVHGIYAIGDVIGGPMLAHKASEEGIACVEQLALGFGHVNYDAIPAVVYTNPEFASVGKTEDMLKDETVAYNKGIFHFRASGRARALGQIEGRVKILADKNTDRILGVHIFGPRAGDLIAEAVLSIQFGASSEDIARTSHAHPTLSEVMQEAALSVEKRQIHS